MTDERESVTLPDNPKLAYGKRYRLKDGTLVYVVMCHKPGNGYGVTVSEQPGPTKWLEHEWYRARKYYPYAKFKRLVVAEA